MELVGVCSFHALILAQNVVAGKEKLLEITFMNELLRRELIKIFPHTSMVIRDLAYSH